MCGIIGLVGPKPKASVALQLLRRLEMRGYDSAGVAVTQLGNFHVRKKKGKIDVLQGTLKAQPIPAGGSIIAHTRWATHGEPNDVNAHPHVSGGGRIAVVHNGTVRNHEALKQELLRDGYRFVSDTDTEVLAHLFERELKKLDGVDIPHFKLERAVANGLKQVQGDDCAILVTCTDFPNEIIAYRRNRPLVIGRGKDVTYVASDAIALAGKVAKIFRLQTGQIATLSRSGIRVEGFSESQIGQHMVPIGVFAKETQLVGYPHWMLQEIFEQPQSIKRATDGRFDRVRALVKLDLLDKHQTLWKRAERIYLVACGTSLHAAMLGKLYIEGRAHIPVEVVTGSEWESAKILVGKTTPVIGLSQSGETADVLGSLKDARRFGAPIFGITNNEMSELASIANDGVYLKAGLETAVASTKTFTSQVAVLLLFAIGLSQLKQKGDSGGDVEALRALSTVSRTLQDALRVNDRIKAIAGEFRNQHRFIFMGRGLCVPTALEGALKLKEIAYVDAHGHPAGEFKHGHLALVERGVPIIGLFSGERDEERTLINLKQAKARGGKIIAFDVSGSEEVAAVADYLVLLPKVPPSLAPIVTTVALQLLSYWSGSIRGFDIDQPRNLAKTVTVD